MTIRWVEEASMLTILTSRWVQTMALPWIEPCFPLAVEETLMAWSISVEAVEMEHMTNRCRCIFNSRIALKGNRGMEGIILITYFTIQGPEVVIKSIKANIYSNCNSLIIRVTITTWLPSTIRDQHHAEPEVKVESKPAIKEERKAGHPQREWKVNFKIIRMH